MNDAVYDLVIDVGNTRTKVALFRGGRMVRRAAFEHLDMPVIQSFLSGVSSVSTVVGSVRRESDQLLDLLHGKGPVLVVRGDTPVPLRNAYSTPLTLGVDRIANAVGAMQLFPGRAVLAIDAGTCITYDLVEQEGSYAGGAISPGVRMRATAMNTYSARLPLVELGGDPGVLGTSTKASLEAGIHHGILGELAGFISAYKYQRPSLAVLLTGGDALRFARALKSGIFAHSLLTLEGLHAILVHHRALHGFPASGSTR